ncbi:MAG: hypothetical protein NWE94_10215 [Candidatus Bathyarchaeota archaeon]|nr:hypothetical protein [Candidatus Bathyarchaeota archaeon]
MSNLPHKQRIILKWIALHGPATEYQLTKEKELGISGFVAHQATGQLAEKRLLSAEAKGKARTGKTIKQYRLTLEGFVEVMKAKDSWAHVDQIIAVNAGMLPEYFGLWSKFKQAGVDNVACTLLSFALERLRSGLPSFPEKINGRKPTLRDWLPRLAIYPWEAYVNRVLSQKEATAFLLVLLEDEEAESLYVSTLQWLADSHRSAMESFNAVLQKYRELKQHKTAGKRFLTLLTSNKPPLEKLELIRQDPELWNYFLQSYPEMKDAKDANEIIDKLTQIINDRQER